DSGSNLFEDWCGFGIGRTVLTETGLGSANNTYRRGWARWEGWGNDGGRLGLQYSYSTAGNSLIENTIVVWSGERQGARLGPGSVAAIVLWRDPPPASENPFGMRFLGSILYGYSSATLKPGIDFSNNAGRTTVRDVVVDDSGFNTWPVYFGCDDARLCPNAVADKLTLIRGTQAGVINGAWAKTNINQAASVTAVPSIYTGDNAANVCRRYVDGTLSSTPLWPWPMDSRIRAALSAAGSSSLAGADATVTSEIESRFGNIPLSCRGSGR